MPITQSTLISITVLAAIASLQACSYTMQVPEQYIVDNSEGCAVYVEDVREQGKSISFGSSELVSQPLLAQVLQREACSRQALRTRFMTIRITSAFCDTSDWAMDAYAEVHARAWLEGEEDMIRTMGRANGSAQGPAQVICGNLLWPLAPQILDNIEARI